MKKTARLRNRREQAGGFFAASIPLIGFLLFGIIPLALSAVISLTELHSTDMKDMVFIGFDNFKTILTNGDKHSYSSYLSTFLYALNAPICIALSLWIAYLINKSKIGKKFFRSVFFIPYVCSSVVITLTFKKLLFNMDAGLLNEALTGMGFKAVGWLIDSPWVFMAAAIFMSIWAGLGWCIVLYQAALANVDQSYYEAARLDGASDAQIFWKITFPAISPTTAYLLTIKLIGALQAMEMMSLLAGSDLTPTWGANDAWVSDTVVKHIYNMVFLRGYQYGYGLGAAAGWILALIVLIITRINLRMQKRWVTYDF